MRSAKQAVMVRSLLLGLLACMPGWAGEVTSVDVGGTPLIIPAPDGFVAFPDQSRLRHFESVLVPEENQLLALFIWKADLPEILSGNATYLDGDWLAYVHAHKSHSAFDWTPTAVQQAQRQIREQDLAARPKAFIGGVEGKSPPTLNPEMQVGDVGLAGIVVDSGDALGYVEVLKLTPADYVLSASAVLWLKARAIALNVDAPYASHADYEKLVEATKDWISAIRSANSATPGQSPPEVGRRIDIPAGQ